MSHDRWKAETRLFPSASRGDNALGKTEMSGLKNTTVPTTPWIHQGRPAPAIVLIKLELPRRDLETAATLPTRLPHHFETQPVK
jgi:hypothetical protein